MHTSSKYVTGYNKCGYLIQWKYEPGKNRVERRDINSVHMNHRGLHRGDRPGKRKKKEISPVASFE